ncbi:actin-like ATPase domain-containing protein [Gyrodon lividus]|nr:actin-like ATPase domain-containing protein [Gyrodon lividus]
MSAVLSTPRRKPSSTAPSATPTTTRVAGTHALQSSPHYTTTRRHSLYGTEDRVVIDPGSRVWKVGFSGEGKPRDVFYADSANSESLWRWSRATDPLASDEEDKLLEINIERCMRSVFHESLLTDPKSRKVILVEHPLLPLYIKDIFAKVLFGNLQVPSISFASCHLLSLLSVGRITGLVIDCGHLESTALPIFAARPMFPHLRTTPLAGARFTSHLRALLLLFGSYIPPPSSLNALNSPLLGRSTRVPQEILTDALVEDIKTRGCFVSTTFETNREAMRSSSPAPPSESDLPPSSDAAMSESEFSRASEGIESVGSSQQASSDFSIVSHPQAPSTESGSGENHLQVLANMYMRHSSATDIQLRVVPPVSQQMGTGRGTLIVPGWIRERAAEVLFEGGDVDESSVAEVILEALLKVPVDLRKTLVSSILTTGGTAMLPGFIPRLHAELLRAIEPPTTLPREPARSGKPLPPAYDRYAALRPLVPHIAILNNPSPQPSSSIRANANAGKAPAFSPASMAWVGGSLAGALKIGGVEVSREKWDEAFSSQIDDDDDDDDDDDMATSPIQQEQKPRNILPDWTRTPLPVSASPAVAAKPPVALLSPQTAVGA